MGVVDQKSFTLQPKFLNYFDIEKKPSWKKMKISMILVALSIAVVSEAKDAAFKERFYHKVGEFKDAVNALKSAKLEAIEDKKRSTRSVKDPSFKARFMQKVGEFKNSVNNLKIAIKGKKNKKVEDWPEEELAIPTTKCHTVFDEVWQEECSTKFNNSCRMETKPVCHTINAKECSPEPKQSCSWVLENKCKTISVPSCSVDWEQRCTNKPLCSTVHKKVCNNVEKDVCVDEFDKVCTMTSVKVCRKVAVREEVDLEDFPEVEPVVHVKGKGEKGLFKNAILDKIEEKTNMKIDSIEAKLLKKREKGEKGKIVKRHTADKKAQKKAAKAEKKAAKAHKINSFLDKIEEKTNKKFDSIASKLAPLQSKLAGKFFKGKGVKAKGGLPIKVKYVKSCEDEPRKTCKTLPRQICHKESVPVCTHESEESCVEKEICKSWPKKNCEMVHKETCWPFPTKKCTEVTTSVCKFVPRQNCVEKTHEVCEAIPVKHCQKNLVKKPREVCIPQPTIRPKEDW